MPLELSRIAPLAQLDSDPQKASIGGACAIIGGVWSPLMHVDPASPLVADRFEAA